ncbi:hypothetical protein PHYNN_206 [Pantoea phage Phynn]|nr:hypothetical protein PHYNN_206 [Pantoea phage Phynn]
MGTFIFFVLFVIVVFMLWHRCHRLDRKWEVEYDDEIQDIIREATRND